MYNIVSSMSFPVYMLVAVGAFVLLGYGIYDMRKKQPGHPMIWSLPFAMFADSCLIIYRCTIEFSRNIILQNVFDIASIISGMLFVIALIVTFIIADKKKFTVQGKKRKKLISMLIDIGVVFIVGVIVIIVGYIIRENNLL